MEFNFANFYSIGVVKIALINCPECGRDNVSDMAKVCPHCGFEIEKYYKTTNSVEHKKSSYIAKKVLIIGLIIGIVWTIYFFATRCEYDGCFNNKLSNGIFCSYHKSQINNFSSYYNSESYSSESTINSSTIFKNLKISNFSSSLGTHSGTMTCEVTNNNAYTVSGYFYVNYYDFKGTLLYSQLMPLDDVDSGETVTCHTLIPKDSYPNDYDSVGFSQASLIKK